MPGLRQVLLAAMIFAAAPSIHSQTAQRVDTVYVHDTVFRADTAANDRYYELAEKAIEHQKDWIDTVLTWFTILLALASVISPILVYQFYRYRREAEKDASDANKQIGELLRESRENADKALAKADKEAEKLLAVTAEKCETALRKVEKAVTEAEANLPQLAKLAAQIEEVRSTVDKAAAPAMVKPTEPDIRLEERLKLIETVDAEEAVEKYEQLVADMQKAGVDASRIPASVHRDVGLSYMALKKWQEAIRELEMYIDAEPTDEHAIFELASAQLNAGKYEESCANWERTANLNPETTEAIGNWGLTFYRMFLRTKKDRLLLDLACRKYEQVAALRPDNEVVYGNWGIALTAMFDVTREPKWLNQAFEKFEQATSIRSDNHKAFIGWGQALTRMYDATQDTKWLDQAIQKYEQVITLNPDDQEVFGNWGSALDTMYDATGDIKWLDLAFQKYERAVTLQPDSPEEFNAWGFAQLKLYASTQERTHFDSAVSKIEQSLKLDPQYPFAWCSLAEAYGYVGDKTRMVENLKKAVDIDHSQKKIARESRFLAAYSRDPDFIALTAEEPPKDEGEKA